MDFSFVFVLFVMMLQLLVIFNPRILLLNLVFGLFGLVFVGAALSGYVAMGLPFHPWFEVFFGLLSALTILVPVLRGRD